MTRTRRTQLSLSSLMLLAGVLFLAPTMTTLGQQQEPSAPPQQPEKAGPAPAKHEPRDPFLPIDYVSPAQQPLVEGPVSTNGVDQVQEGPLPPQAGQISWPKLNLKAVMTNPAGKRVAMIEGIGVVEAGDIVSKKKDGMTYRWRVEEVAEKDVSFTRLDARPSR